MCQVSLERPVAPAPGLPADISADLASQPRYVDVSTSFGITGPTDSFSNMFSYGSSTGVSYSEDVRLQLSFYCFGPNSTLPARL